MNCNTCKFFQQSPNFPQWGKCQLLGGDVVKTNHLQCQQSKVCKGE
ncbi:high-potential iron-sulfur protein [Anabaena catenula]|uniref:High-potential iron-sulfur protein n=1 Tax=Anabaena catenula FACHB-362 TaxID=2692877 RepID=A0ABR8J909_9NOST|nr:high-potential iron-sulfur protein [Anabaena catenula FACHB-362]